MADNYTGDIMRAAEGKQDIKELGAQWLEYNDIQKRITEEYNKQNTALDKLLGFHKSINMNIIDQVTREFKLKRELKNLEKEISDLQETSHHITDENKRKEAKVSLEAMLQRRLSLTKEMELLNKINRSGLGVFLFFIGRATELFQQMDTAAAKFRNTMGFMRKDAADIRNEAQRIAIDFMHVGVNIEGVYESFLALGKEMGSVHIVSTELVKTTALLKAQLGVAEESTAEFLRNMAAVAGSSMEAQQSMAFMAGSLANAAGVPLSVVMKDIATRSNITLTMMSRLPSQIIRSAVELRKMGTDMDKASKSSRELLNFTDNVQAEMEASVLLGHSINLQKARELAYNRDLVGSTREILRLAKESNFAHGMDVFQQEAFARATGKSVDELLSLLQTEQQWNKARASADPVMRRRVAEYDKIKALNDAALKDQGKQLEMMVIQQSNQARLVAITQKWNQILAKILEGLLPVIDITLSIIPPLMEAASQTVIWTGRILALAKSFEYGFAILSNFFSLIGRIGRGFAIFTSIASKFAALSVKFGEIAGWVLKISSFFGKWVPIIGWVITGIQFVINLARRWISIFSDPNLNIGQKIIKGLLAIPLAVYDTLIKPFVDAFKWIVHKLGFGANSPSKLGLMIVKGIAGVGAMLFDALTFPFRHAFAWILEKIPGMGRFASKLKGGATEMVQSVQGKATAEYIPAVTVTPTGTTVMGEPAAATAATPAAQQTTQTTSRYSLDDIYDMLKQLNDNLTSGKVKAGDVYLDSSLVSTMMARNIEFRGGYGVNR